MFYFVKFFGNINFVNFIVGVLVVVIYGIFFKFFKKVGKNLMLISKG